MSKVAKSTPFSVPIFIQMTDLCNRPGVFVAIAFLLLIFVVKYEVIMRGIFSRANLRFPATAFGE